MVVWSLYKVPPTVGEEARNRSEYYSLGLEHLNVREGDRFPVFENHGWWSETEGRAILNQKTLEPEDSLSWKEAKAIFDAAVANRVSSGFTHLYTVDPLSEFGYSYQEVTVEDMLPPSESV